MILLGLLDPENEGITVFRNVGNYLAIGIHEDFNLQQYGCVNPIYCVNMVTLSF
jgi:hypothetical protein